MASVNLTRQFEEFRRARWPRGGSARRPQGSPSEFGLLADDSVGVSDVNPSFVMPPKWVDIVDQIQADIVGIKRKFVELEALHSDRLKVSFGATSAEQEAKVDTITSQISMLIKKCEGSIKRIATMGTDRDTLSQQERVVRLNVMRSLGSELQNLSKKFRILQKGFMTRLRGQEEVGSQFFDNGNGASNAGGNNSSFDGSFDSRLDRAMSAGEIAELEQVCVCV
jgi:syntaxin 16